MCPAAVTEALGVFDPDKVAPIGVAILMGTMRRSVEEYTP